MQITANELKQAVKTSAPLVEAITLGKIRIRLERDDYMVPDFNEMYGDMFCPKANPDINADSLKKQKAALKRRIRDQGYYTAIAEYWNGREWAEDGLTDNVIGAFIGKEVIGSGYERDLLNEALEAYNNQTLDRDGFVIDPYRLAS